MLAPDCSFVLSVERGKLEAQALLLVESLRRFGGVYAQSPVYAVSPRPSRRPSAECQHALARLGVHVILESLLSADEAYGTVSRLRSCVWAEQNLSTEILVSLDDDLFFAGEPDFRLETADFFARPVDMKGMCTSGDEDAFDPYWRRICEVCDVDYKAIPWVETTVDRIRVKASYNGGMVAVRRSAGIFQSATEMFEILRSSDLAPRELGTQPVFASTGFVGAEATRWWGSAQAVLSLAATRVHARVAIAPSTYNVPAHLAEDWQKAGVKISLQNAILVHYHWLLDANHHCGRSVFCGAHALPHAVFQWLQAHAPL